MVEVSPAKADTSAHNAFDKLRWLRVGVLIKISSPKSAVHFEFFSVPMSDAHLVVAQTEHEGIGCFFVPRRLSDGSLNQVHVQRLKEKVGNRSNSSSEVEFQNAWGIMIGEEGRGIPTIIEMANYTRLTCSVGSTAILRQALVQCLAYTRQRQTFGKALAEQPLM